MHKRTYERAFTDIWDDDKMKKRMIRDEVKYEIVCDALGWCEVFVDDVSIAKVVSYEEGRRVIFLGLVAQGDSIGYVSDDMFEDFK